MRSPESSYLPSPIVGQAILRLKVGEEPAPVRRVLATPPSTPTHTHPLAPLISGRTGSLTATEDKGPADHLVSELFHSQKEPLCFGLALGSCCSCCPAQLEFGLQPVRPLWPSANPTCDSGSLRRLQLLQTPGFPCYEFSYMSFIPLSCDLFIGFSLSGTCSISLFFLVAVSGSLSPSLYRVGVPQAQCLGLLLSP